MLSDPSVGRHSAQVISASSRGSVHLAGNEPASYGVADGGGEYISKDIRSRIRDESKAARTSCLTLESDHPDHKSARTRPVLEKDPGESANRFEIVHRMQRQISAARLQ